MRLRSFIKLVRGCYHYSALMILTVVLVTFYLIQMTFLSSFINKKYGKKIDADNELQQAEFIFFTNTKFEGEQLVHFDFKGAPPKISYLVKFLPFIKSLGATGILLEYEDMFPYQGELQGISAANAYTLSDIATIIQTAQANNLTIIPLIPTFNHFEFVLKLEKFRRFREVDHTPKALCPSQADVYPILYNMIDQVIAAHPTSEYLHIACDEPFIVGQCSKCHYLMKMNKWRKSDVYFNHVKKLAEYIGTRYPKVRPIVWGDKFLRQNEKTFLAHKIPDLVDVMLWNYGPDNSSFPRRYDMNNFAKLFKNIWIAGAFKGATGSTKIVTDPDYHLRNTKAWMHFVQEWKTKINFKGMVLTGWQRYSHFEALCELLPVGIPSLALSLRHLNEEKDSDFEGVKRALGCSDTVPLNIEETQKEKISNLKCDYPGFRIYQLIHIFFNAALKLRKLLKLIDTRHMSFYSITYNLSNSAFIYKLNVTSYKDHLERFIEMESDIRAALSEVYDEHTINEWIFTHAMPLRLHLEAAIKLLSGLRGRTVWPRRPFLDVTPSVQQFFNKTCSETETLGCTLFHLH